MNAELILSPQSAPDAAEIAVPHSLDAEQALLGALLSDNEVAHAIPDALRGEHFYDPVNGRIFDEAKGMIERGELADAITMTPFADGDPGVKPLGGGDYLVELMASGARAAEAPDYAKLVHDLALRRSLIRVGGEIEVEAREERSAQARDLIEGAERKLFKLAETGSAARGFETFGTALQQSIEMAAAAMKEGGLSGISTGFQALDSKLGGLHRSDLLIIAGRPSMGKTAFATNIAFRVAKAFRKERDDKGGERTAAGGVVGFFSLEMSSEQLATRILSDRANVLSHLIRQGQLSPQEFEKLRDAAIELNQLPLHIDDTGGLSIGALCSRARRLKRQKGLDLIIVDYLQLVTPSSDRRSDSRVQEVSEVTQNLKALAKELDVPVIALSQLSRQVESREDKRPQLSDLRESGSIEQDADAVMFVFREEYYLSREEPADSRRNSAKEDDRKACEEWDRRMAEAAGKAEIIIGKQRHGPIGTVKLGFDGSVTRFDDLAEEGRYPAMDRSGPSGPGLGA